MPDILEQHSPSDLSCAGDCQHCHTVPENPDAPLGGLRFSVASITAFLLPPSLALAGGLICDGSTDQRTFGVLAGLAIGATLAWMFNRFLCRESKWRSADAGVTACGARNATPQNATPRDVTPDKNTRLNQEPATRSHDG